MKRGLILVVPAVLVAVFAARPLWSEDKPGDEAAEVMKPGPEHESLAKLVGKYDVSGKFFGAPGTEPTTNTGKAEFKAVLGGRFFQQDFSGEIMEMPYQGIATIGYDRTLKRYTEHWVDNVGTGATFLTGKSADGGKTITFKGKMTSPEMGAEIDTRWVHTHKSEDEFTFEMYLGAADSEFQVMELTYTRAK